MASLLALPPFQLAAQDLEEVISRAKQIDLMLGAAATHAVSVAQIHARLSIKAEVGDLIFRAEKDLDLGRIRHHERPVGQRMWGHGRDDQRTYGGHENRAPGR